MSGGRITRSTSSGASRIVGSPGTRAIPIPAIIKMIDGAVLSRCATMAAAASTASINRSVSIVPVMESCSAGLDQVGNHVHGQRQDRNVEEERQNAVHCGDATDHFAGDCDVRYLRCHRNYKREIDEVPIIRALLS